jgi:predicted lipid-binding transport protein (Tim44 family)
VRRGVAAALMLLAATEAAARVGGGQGFGVGGGGRGGGGSWGGGGGSGGDSELGSLLVWLVLQHPMIGVPVLLVVVVWAINNAGSRPGGATPGGWRGFHGRPGGGVTRRQGRVAAAEPPGWTALRIADPGLSEPVFHDYVQLVVRRAWEAAAGGPDAPAWEALASQIAPGVRGPLGTRLRGVVLSDVCLAATTVLDVTRADAQDRIDVRVAATRVEDGATRYVEEVWTFGRAVGAKSATPEATIRVGCPSCGSAMGTDTLGRCKACGTPVAAGQLGWQAVVWMHAESRPVTPMDVSWSEGGREPGYELPIPDDPELGTQARAFRGRHPTHDDTAFEAHLRTTFLALQRAWSDDRWEDARRFTTDSCWNTLRFQVERYRRDGLRNRVDEVRIAGVRLLRLDVDGWLESATVRFWASCLDWTERTDGSLVGGNRDARREFSEVWTFVRAVGADEGPTPHCPSCGGPLHAVEAAGRCPHCGSVVLPARFGWVVARIEQPEVYRR